MEIEAKEVGRIHFYPPEKDPSSPKNFSTWLKIVLLLEVMFVTFTVSFTIGEPNSSFQIIGARFDKAPITTSILYLLHITGIAAGSSFAGPLSELFGRKKPLILCCLLHAILTFSSGASETFEALAILRFTSALASAGILSVAPPIVADVFRNPLAGCLQTLVQSLLILAGFSGVSIGYYIAYSSLGWRYTFYVPGIMMSIGLFIALFIPETYAPVILNKKAAKMRLDTGNFAYHAEIEEEMVSLSNIFKVYILRPLRMVLTEPLLFFLDVYVGIAYFLFLISIGGLSIALRDTRTTDPHVIARYYLAATSGAIVGIFVIQLTYGRMLYHRSKVNLHLDLKKTLLILQMSSLFTLAGPFITGWFLSLNFLWVIPCIGIFFTGLGISITFAVGNSLISRCYARYIASSFAAITMVRNFIGIPATILAYPILGNLGVRWGESLCGFLGILASMIPLVGYLYCEKLEKHSPIYQTSNINYLVHNEEY